MYRTVCYCLVINMVAVYGFNGFDCTESDIIVTEKFCKHENTTQFYMQTFTGDILHARNLTAASLVMNGCPFEFENVEYNNKFYIECETEINCADDKEDIAVKTMNSFVLECEDISLFNDNATSNVTELVAKDSVYASAQSTKDDEPPDTRQLIIVTSSVAAGLATVVGAAAALYKLQSILQSGSYLFPNTPAEKTGFMEMA